MILVFMMIYFQVFPSQFCRDFEKKWELKQIRSLATDLVIIYRGEKMHQCVSCSRRVNVDVEGREGNLDSISVLLVSCSLDLLRSLKLLQ